MTDLTPNLPEVVAEVRALFGATSCIDRQDRRGLDAPLGQPAHHPLRAARERLRLRGDNAHRVRRPPGPGIKELRRRLEILTLGRDIATVNLEFKVRGRDLIGRQSQTWVRFPDLGWKVVAAHVSTMNAAPLW